MGPSQEVGKASRDEGGKVTKPHLEVPAEPPECRLLPPQVIVL